MKRWVAILPIAVLLAGCGGGQSKAADDKKAPPPGDTGTLVRVAAVTTRPMQQTVNITGSLNTLEDVYLSPKLSGRLSRVLVRPGDHVRAGQLVAEQESTELMTQLRQAEAGLASARSSEAQAKLEAAMSPVQTEASVRGAEAALGAANANLRKLETGSRPEDIAQAQKAVDSARLDYEWNKQEFDRYSELVKQDALNRRVAEQAKIEMDKAMAKWDSAVQALKLLQIGPRKEDIDAARQQVRQAEQNLILAKANRPNDTIKKEKVVAARAAVAQAQSTVQLAKQQIDNTRIYSPVDGQVEERTGHPGQMAMAGAPILRVISMNTVYFEGNVPETEIRNITVGQRVTVAIDALPGQQFSAAVAAIRPVANEQARQFTVRIALTDGAGRLKPGMFARGSIVSRNVPNAVVAPKDAIVSRGGEPSVFVIENGVAHARKVTVGLSSPEFVELTGIQVGDLVVVKGADTLSDGAKVSIEKSPSGGQE